MGGGGGSPSCGLAPHRGQSGEEAENDPRNAHDPPFFFFFAPHPRSEGIYCCMPPFSYARGCQGLGSEFLVLLMRPRSFFFWYNALLMRTQSARSKASKDAQFACVFTEVPAK
jgi:hypothetical protein